jgi:hypothetical protein
MDAADAARFDVALTVVAAQRPEAISTARSVVAAFAN